MPFDPRQLGMLVGSLGGNPAFLRGYSRAMQELQQRKAQEQQLGIQQSQEQRAQQGVDMQQQRLMLDAEQQRRAAEQQQMKTVADASGMLMDEDITDPATFDQRLAFLSRVAPSLDPGFLQSLRPPVTTFQKRAAVKKLAEIEKAYSPTQMAMFEADDATGAAPVFIVNGEKLTVAQLRERAGTQATIDGKPMSMRPAAKAQDVTAGSFEEFVNAPPERQAQIAAARQKYTEAGREPNAPAQGSPQWVITETGATRYRVPQPGDTPRDPVAERKKPDEEASPYAAERATRTVQSVDELMGKVSRWTTGYGSMLAAIPETDAANFQAELDTLKANIAFNELTAMREASKTGGALGQVSNVELGLLTSALGALNTRQSPANLKKQLQKIRDSVTRWSAARGANPVIAPPAGDGWVDVGGGVRVREKK